jgi:hypothetical protein
LGVAVWYWLPSSLSDCWKVSARCAGSPAGGAAPSCARRQRAHRGRGGRHARAGKGACRERV